MQDLRIIDPDRKKEPNFKVAPFLEHLNTIFKDAYCLRKNISIDEMTISFKGNHKDKLCMNYKKARDRFQCNAICQDRYCYQFKF